MSEGSEDLWIFGYGSLVWRCGFEYAERREVWLRGFQRRFWQGSTDHRGVEGSPGRVVTLVPADDEAVWGVAYRVSAEAVPSVLNYLDFREKGGYSRAHFPLHDSPTGGDPTVDRALVYYATAGNDNYLGPAPLPELAQTIRKSVGPSGPNFEYFERLLVAVRAARVLDAHLEELAVELSL